MTSAPEPRRAASAETPRVGPGRGAKGYLVVALLMIAAVPVTIYWVVGDRGERWAVSQGSDRGSLQYIIEPPDWSPTAVTAAGVASTMVLVAGAVLLVWATWRGRLDRRWLVVTGCLMAAAAIVGFGYRAAATGVIGANIGFGLVVLFGTPVCLAFLISALGIARTTLRQRSAP